MGQTQNTLLRTITTEYLDTLDEKNMPEPSEIERELITRTREAFDMRNAIAPKSNKWFIPNVLSPIQIATVMAKAHNIARLATSGATINPDYDMVAIYQTDGPEKGTYTTSEDEFRRIARSYKYTLNSREFQEIMIALRELVPRRVRSTNPDFVAVNNGIFNYQTKELLDFSPDEVFLSKSHVNFNPHAKNVVIHNPTDGTNWDIESWMNELSDDPEIVHVLWQILGAIIRPNVRWNKSAWFYSEVGNNGKGTLAELMRNLCGPGSYASIPLNAFSSDFMLEPLVSASAIIVDENDVGTYVDKAANLKAVITNDVITINRKFKSPIAYQFFGFMVQCLNEFPKIKDKSDSFYRRQLFIPFDKTFTGRERRYIKSDYMSRPEVLEYVLKKVLHDMNYYVLDEPAACKDILKEYMEFNDPVRQFWEDAETQMVWDLVPFTFLYAFYRAWMALNMPEGRPIQRNRFISELLNLVDKSEIWYCTDKNAQVRTGSLMNEPEPIIVQYNLTDWLSKTYKGSDVAKLASPSLNDRYRGILRYPDVKPSDDKTDDDI